MPETVRQTESGAVYYDADLITNSNDAGYDAEAIGLFFRELDLGADLGKALRNQERVWTRIESFVSHRWHSRTVEWIVKGEGDWEPPLEPASITVTECWDTSAQAWASVSLDVNPFGGVYIPEDGSIYRITATVGTGLLSDLPQDVRCAFQRLHNYMSAGGISSDLDWNDKNVLTSAPGASKVSMQVSTGEGSSASFDVDRSPRAIARALEYSGAGDLLRKYRKGR